MRGTVVGLAFWVIGTLFLIVFNLTLACIVLIGIL